MSVEPSLDAVALYDTTAKKVGLRFQSYAAADQHVPLADLAADSAEQVMGVRR